MNAARVIVAVQGATAESTTDSIRSWFIAFGTVGATMVALYVVFRERWRRPKLTLKYSPPETQAALEREGAPDKNGSEDDAVVVTRECAPNDKIATKTGGDEAWIRLRVEAKKGRHAAENVEVMILRAEELEPRAYSPLANVPSSPNPALVDADRIRLLGGQLLQWAHSHVTRLTIPPDTHRHLDLILVYRTETRAQSAAARIQVAPPPEDGRHLVMSGSFKLELAVTTRNADARRYLLKVIYDGKWGKGRQEIWDHLIVSRPDASPPARWEDL